MTDALTTLGLPAELPREAADELRLLLVDLWRSAHERDPDGLRPDLLAHQRFFDPIARGARLRTQLMGLKPTQIPPGFPSSLALTVGDQRALITPEGRVAIELLDRALELSGSAVSIDRDLAAVRVSELFDLYRDASRQRLNQVLELLGGSDTPLQLPAIGATLTLLVNRSDAPERAIKRFPRTDPEAQSKIDQAFFAAAEAFRSEIPARRRQRPSGGRGQSSKERLISGWTLHEVTRRMPDALVIDKESMYVNPTRKDDLLDLIARELASRSEVDSVVLSSAFDALVRAFRSTAPVLAGFGVLFERPSDTDRLRTTLLQRFNDVAAI